MIQRTESCDPRSRRRDLAQRPRREAEERVRQLAVTYARSCQPGLSPREIAKQFGVCERTVRHWKSNGDGMKPVACRGRRPKTCSVEQRNEVIRFLREVSGPVVGLAALQALFHTVPRSILEDLLRRYRRVWRYRYQQTGFRLTWKRAGSMWAIDFSKPSHPIDGIYDCLFAARDLGSHHQLAWHPFHGETAWETIPVLEDLFRRHGPPLVVKSDNGSAFIAEIFGDLLRSWGVWQLFSPPRHPQYNGALERSNGTLKTFTHQHAIREGHPFRWTSTDVEHARQLANTLSRPWGHRGPSPEEAWEQRATITAEEREEFQQAVARHRSQARTDLGLDETFELNGKDQSRINRMALSRALAELDYLAMHRVRRPPKKPKRLSHPELTLRAVRATLSVPRLTYQPSASSDTQAPPSPSDKSLTPAPDTTLCDTSEAIAVGSTLSAADRVETTGSVSGRTVQDDEPARLRGHRTRGRGPATGPTRRGPTRRAPTRRERRRSPVAGHRPRGSRPTQATLPAVSMVATAPPEDACERIEKLPQSLAMLPARATMRRHTCVDATPPMMAPMPEPAHRERSHTSWLRRTITLIISLAKMAIISRL